MDAKTDLAWRARKDIVTFAHKVQERGFVAATDGNLSVRLGPNRFMITPSGVPKGETTMEGLLVIDGEGNVVEGVGAASVEAKLHLECYRQRADVNAVIHAHPPKCIAFTLAGVPLATCVLPEVVVTMGQVPVSEYATPSTDEVPESIRDIIGTTDAIILARHGSVTVGATVEAAFRKLEKLEQTAEISFYAHLLGGVQPFRQGELEKLHGLREVWGVKTRVVPCSSGGSCGYGKCSAKTGQVAAPAAATGGENLSAGLDLDGADINRLVDYIVEQVRKSL